MNSCSDESRNWFCSVGSKNEEFVVLLVRLELVEVAISGDSWCGIDPNAVMIAQSTCNNLILMKRLIAMNYSTHTSITIKLL